MLNGPHRQDTANGCTRWVMSAFHFLFKASFPRRSNHCQSVSATFFPYCMSLPGIFVGSLMVSMLASSGPTLFPIWPVILFPDRGRASPSWLRLVQPAPLAGFPRVDCCSCEHGKSFCCTLSSLSVTLHPATHHTTHTQTHTFSGKCIPAPGTSRDLLNCFRPARQTYSHPFLLQLCFAMLKYCGIP